MYPDPPFDEESSPDPTVQPEITPETAASSAPQVCPVELPASEDDAINDDEDVDIHDDEDIAEYEEFMKLDPDYEHRKNIIRRHLERLEGPRRQHRRRSAPAFDPTKTAAERELAEKQQYTHWEREGVAWFNEQHSAGRFDEWLNGYQVNAGFTVESFAKSYSTAYANFRAYGSSFAGWLDSQKLQFRDAAVKLLWQIQQKKLFDLQCHWRAGQVTIPGVDIIEDFDYWNDRLHRCSFLSPITDEEFALYRAYAESADFDEEGVCTQNYERFKQEQAGDPDDDGVEMAEWYQFHNARTGNGKLLLLPDMRGQREAHYREVYYAHWLSRSVNERVAQGQAPSPSTLPTSPAPPDLRPRLLWYDYYQDRSTNREHIAYDFLRRFAPDPGVLQHLKAVNSTRFDDRGDLQEAFDLLLEVREPIHIEAHPNWREALKRTAARYQREQIIAALDVVYDDYKMREQFGLAHSPYTEYPSSNRAQLLIERLDVLKGRILCGEPATFDY